MGFSAQVLQEFYVNATRKQALRLSPDEALEILRSLGLPRGQQNERSCLTLLALAKLKEPASQKRAMWNRRAVEYTAKINSGNPELLAEVVRDLYRGDSDKDPSHGERVLFEQAFGRLTHELAAIDKSQVEEATAKVEGLLKAA